MNYVNVKKLSATHVLREDVTYFVNNIFEISIRGVVVVSRVCELGPLNRHHSLAFKS